MVNSVRSREPQHPEKISYARAHYGVQEGIILRVFEYIQYVRGGIFTPCSKILTPALTTESGEEFYSGCLGLIIKHAAEPQSTHRDYSEVPTAPHTRLRVYIPTFLDYAPYRAFRGS